MKWKRGVVQLYSFGSFGICILECNSNSVSGHYVMVVWSGSLTIFGRYKMVVFSGAVILFCVHYELVFWREAVIKFVAIMKW